VGGAVMVRVAGRRVSMRFNAAMWGRVENDFMLQLYSNETCRFGDDEIKLLLIDDKMKSILFV
jgi:hypothetical protein